MSSILVVWLAVLILMGFSVSTVRVYWSRHKRNPSVPIAVVIGGLYGFIMGLAVATRAFEAFSAGDLVVAIVGALALGLMNAGLLRGWGRDTSRA